uniref:ZBR-type domain-containing protein n=1 Tax=Rhodnius prolixus TaxID=13249 RepID=T1HJN3_RHOPR
MTSSRLKEGYGSPMDESYVWATPRNSQKDLEPACKRKYDDSGYASCSSVSKSASKVLVNTPEDTNERFNGNEGAYTPYIKASPQAIKKRIFNKSEGKFTTYNCSSPAVDSYSDFLIDASLYTEPMEITSREAALCMITEEPDSSLGVTEISKQIDVNLEIEPSSPNKTLNSPKKKPRSPFKKKGSYRSLYGFEKVDIMFQLGERKDYSVIVTKILSYLSDNDLSNVTMVSSTWRNVCLKDNRARSRWYNYVEDLKERKENLHLEARTLKENEVLMECPRCSRPSACSPSTLVGECRGIACMLKFCTVCRTPAHDRSPCPFLTPVTPTKRKHTTIGSKESKRFLRRL